MKGKLPKSFEEIINMETLYIADIVEILPIGDPDRKYLVNEQANGLDRSTHVTIKGGCDKDTKIKIIREMVHHFKDVDNDVGTRITSI